MNKLSVFDPRHALRAALLLAVLKASPAMAEPYLALRTENHCATCHHNPTGGGARNALGSYYGAAVLPARPGSPHASGGQLTDYLRLGSDWRFTATDRASDGLDQRGFQEDTGQLYLFLQPQGARFAAYFDQQLLPGGSLTREAFALITLGEEHYLKAGTFVLPFGLKLQDDTALVRQATQVNFANSDRGVEWGYRRGRVAVQGAITNGGGGAANNDRKFQFTGRVEYLRGSWRVGAAYLLNDAVDGRRRMGGLFGGWQAAGYGILFEVDGIRDAVGMEDVDQLVTLVELNKEIAQGYNLKLTAEYLDPQRDYRENERTRHSLLLEYTPFAFLQVRTGMRFGDDIPQRPQDRFTQVLAQLHFYF